MKNKPHVVLIGPPAAGKGTIANYLVTAFDYYQLSTGDLLRQEKASGSDLGKEIGQLIDHGKMVPDEVSKDVMVKNLPKEQPIIFDGYPRNINQANILEKDLVPSFSKNNLDDVVVLFFDVEFDEARY